VLDTYDKYLGLLKAHDPIYVVGFDETGNGAIAGPLCVAGCALSVGFSDKIKDSKLYTTDKARRVAYELVLKKSTGHVTYTAVSDHIERFGHGEILERLYDQALECMYAQFGDSAVYILDGNRLSKYSSVPHTCLVKADKYVPAVSAASIIAKYERDQMVISHPLAKEFALDKNKGYGTIEHLNTLDKVGPIKGFHRMNIDKVKKAFNKRGWYSS
jgi:ribonuclease HII